VCVLSGKRVDATRGVKGNVVVKIIFEEKSKRRKDHAEVAKERDG